MMETTIPAKHKELGRQVKGFDGKKWDKREWAIRSSLEFERADSRSDKSRIVAVGNYLKFTKSEEAAEMTKKLLATGDRELVEVCCWGARSFVLLITDI
jgi:predicted NAD-dependent protein-ADP-ribosyltransferase YbiA (DUF1768 family)